MAEELISINLWLSGRSYRIRIKPEEEEMVRKAVKIANEKISEMKTDYAGKDEQDYIAMCLLTYATDGVTGSSGSLLEKEINGIVGKIDKVLNAEE